MKGYVYVISNPKAMPGLIKVGCSLKDPELRAKELSGTASPHPYIVEYEMLVKDAPEQIEKQAHKHLRGKHEGKEWFRCSAEEAVVAIRFVAGEAKIQEFYKKADREKAEQLIRQAEQQRQQAALLAKQRSEEQAKQLAIEQQRHYQEQQLCKREEEIRRKYQADISDVESQPFRYYWIGGAIAAYIAMAWFSPTLSEGNKLFYSVPVGAFIGNAIRYFLQKPKITRLQEQCDAEVRAVRAPPAQAQTLLPAATESSSAAIIRWGIVFIGLGSIFLTAITSGPHPSRSTPSAAASNSATPSTPAHTPASTPTTSVPSQPPSHRLWTGSFTNQKAVVSIYGPWQSNQEAALWTVPSSFISRFELDKTYPGGQAYVRLLLSQSYYEQGKPQRVIVVNASPVVPEANNCPTCGALIGINVLTQVEDVWQITPDKSDFRLIRSASKNPYYSWVRIGKDHSALLEISGYRVTQDIIAEHYNLYRPKGSSIVSIFEEGYAGETKMNTEILPNSQKEYFDIKVTKPDPTISATAKKEMLYQFKNGKYVLVNSSTM